MTRTPNWMHDIPSLPGDARRESERAVNLSLADQAACRAIERARWSSVLGPHDRPAPTPRPVHRANLAAIAAAIIIVAAGLAVAITW